MICERCGNELVEVDNPLRRETRHKRGVECVPIPDPDGWAGWALRVRNEQETG